MNRDGFTQAREQIMQGAVYLTMGVNAAEDRFDRAAQAGADLAAEVYRFTQDPEGVGTEALDAAYAAFMGQHAGGFTEEITDAH